eukprot:4691891-Pyramimonas_sp.AAC.2
MTPLAILALVPGGGDGVSATGRQVCDYQHADLAPISPMDVTCALGGGGVKLAGLPPTVEAMSRVADGPPDPPPP